MDSPARIISVFDKFHKLENPSGWFGWQPPAFSYKFNKSDLICTGELQEIEATTSAIHSTKYYAATPKELLRFTHAQLTFPDAVLKLPLPRMELFRDRLHWKYGFSLTAHEVTLKFAARNKEEAGRWYNRLKRMCEVVVLHISRDFVVGKIVGRGNYSKVHIATSTGNEGPAKYSIKSVLKNKLFDDARTLKNMMNEIRMLRQLPHPGVIKLFEIYESEQYVHLVFEYTKDTQIFSILRAKENYSEADAARIMKSLLQVVANMHSKQIIHRDIKPDNIMLTYYIGNIINDRKVDNELSVKIVNFGLSTKQNGVHLETLCCGSPGYVAPEVLRKEGYGMKADIYSCGIILYIMLTGIAPFAGKDIEEIIEKNRRAEIDYPMDIWKNVTPDALDLVIKMTERDQYKRLSAKECLEHSWFSMSHSGDKTLGNVIFNLKTLGAEQLNQAEHTREFSRKIGLNTTSPLFMKRTLPSGKGNLLVNYPAVDSPLLSTKERASKTQSQTMLFSIIKSTVNNTKEKHVPKLSDRAVTQLNPFLQAITFAEEEAKNTLNDAEGDEEIPSERGLTQQKRPLKVINKSFIPEADETRTLPSMRIINGVSKRLLEKSTHFMKVLSVTRAEERRMNKSFVLGDKVHLASMTDFTICHKVSTKDSERTPRAETMPRKIRLNVKK